MSIFSEQEAAHWTGGVWDPRGPSSIDGVSHDTRTVRPGDLFVAIKGPKFDGHNFVEQAFDRGAVGAVVARNWRAPASAEQPVLRVDDPGRALGDLAAAYRRIGSPAIVAVTGSAGKTTVKEMTVQALATQLPTAGTRGNWNNEIGLPLSLLAMAPATRVGVFEVGTNHPGETRRLCGILRPTWGVVTSLGPVHIEFFGSVEAIAQEKADVLRSLPAEGVAVLNRDVACFDIFRQAAPGRVVTVGIGGVADYVCLRRDAARQEFTVAERATQDEVLLRLRAPGEHNVANALLAIAVARGFGVSWDGIAQALANFAALPMRWEREEIRGVQLINDAYNANPISMQAALRAFAEAACRGRRWLVLAGMLELGDQAEGQHRALGEFVGRGPWAGLIVVGSLGRLIAQGAQARGMKGNAVIGCENNREAAAALARCVEPGDTVLLKGSRSMHLEEVADIFKANRGA